MSVLAQTLFENKVLAVNYDVLANTSSIVFGNGQGEFVYDPQPVLNANTQDNIIQLYFNVNVQQETTNFSDCYFALNQLQQTFPNLNHVYIKVCWYVTSTDLANTKVYPGVVNNTASVSTSPYEWSAAEFSRTTAYLVSSTNGIPSFSGTPSDVSLLNLVLELNSRGIAFSVIMSLIIDETGFPPVTQLTTTSTTQETDIQTFFGPLISTPNYSIYYGVDEILNVSFTGQANQVGTYNNFVMYYAQLFAQFKSQFSNTNIRYFLIGEHLSGITSINVNGTYPGVTALVNLAETCHSLLNPQGILVSYLADWNEWNGTYPEPNNFTFPAPFNYSMDELWTSDYIDFVALSPNADVTDWRYNGPNIDAVQYNGVYNPFYLLSGTVGGPYSDYFYSSQSNRDLQIRTPIIGPPSTIMGESPLFTIPFFGEYLPSNISVVRNSVATVMNKEGVIVNVPPNYPRIDYSTGSPKLLIESASANYIGTSYSFVDAAISINGVNNNQNPVLNYGNNSYNIPPLYENAPNSYISIGSQTAVYIEFFAQVPTVQLYTASIYIYIPLSEKSASENYGTPFLEIFQNGNNLASVYAPLSFGSWQRISCSVVLNNTQTVSVTVNYTVSSLGGSYSFWLACVQLEPGELSSFIPNNNPMYQVGPETAVSRSADELYYLNTNNTLDAWLYSFKAYQQWIQNYHYSNPTTTPYPILQDDGGELIVYNQINSNSSYSSYINSSGVMEYSQNAQRIDYTNGYPVYLNELSSQNLQIPSQGITGGYGISGTGTIVPNGALNIDGTQSAVLIEPNSTGLLGFYFGLPSSVVVGNYYTASCYVQIIGSTTGSQLNFPNNYGGANTGGLVDFQTKTFTSVSTNNLGGMVIELPNNWFYIVSTFIAVGAPYTDWTFYFTSSSLGTKCVIGGIQLENGASYSSYINTVLNPTGIREADNFTTGLPQVSTGWIPNSKMIAFIGAQCPSINLASNEPSANMNQNSTDYLIPYFSNGASDNNIPYFYFTVLQQALNAIGVALDIAFSYWDARPYPWYPLLNTQWADSVNYVLGNAINNKFLSIDPTQSANIVVDNTKILPSVLANNNFWSVFADVINQQSNILINEPVNEMANLRNVNLISDQIKAANVRQMGYKIPDFGLTYNQYDSIMRYLGVYYLTKGASVQFANFISYFSNIGFKYVPLYVMNQGTAPYNLSSDTLDINTLAPTPANPQVITSTIFSDPPGPWVPTPYYNIEYDLTQESSALEALYLSLFQQAAPAHLVLYQLVGVATLPNANLFIGATVTDITVTPVGLVTLTL